MVRMARGCRPYNLNQKTLIKMKRIISLLLGVVAALVTLAAPADRTPVPVPQPDGTTLMLRLVGDEFFHYNTTIDGYTILPVNGGWQYAISRNGRLQPSGMLAHDLALRTETEKQWLAQVPRHLTSASDITAARQARARRDGPAERTPTIDYGNFHGLIVLVDYSDKQFSMDNPGEFYERMINQENYTGFDYNGQFVPCTGSVRDYFTAQSGGRFVPQFDVVGPVTVPYECTAHTGNSNSWRVFKAAMDSVDALVNLKDYDLNHDGMADMIIFIGAGFASNYGGNNSNYLWPHKSFLYNYDSHSYLKYDNTYAGTYAATVEMYGWEAEPGSTPMGIGTIAHEFGHVLGLLDHYDTDYANGGGQSHDPGDWDVMAAGNNLNQSRTPCGYNLFERYALGWACPPVIDQSGDHTLNPLHTSNEGYILKTSVDNEYFMLENRQQTGWDAYLPGHGLLVWRVDSTNTTVWDMNQNKVNANPAHNYFELLRAGGSVSGAKASDPFPGSGNVTVCSNYKLRTWSGEPNTFMLDGIAEQGGIITFSMVDMSQAEKMVETFDRMEVTTANSEQVGDIATWKLLSSRVVATDEGKAIAMYYPSTLTMTTPESRNINRVTFEVQNTSTTLAKFTLFYSLDEGATWQKATTTNFEVPVGVNTTIDWLGAAFGQSQRVRFRVGMVAGNKTVPCIIDNFTIYYSGSEAVTGDVNGDGAVDVTDVNEAINMILGKAVMDTIADLDGNGTVDVSDVNQIINIILGK